MDLENRMVLNIEENPPKIVCACCVCDDPIFYGERFYDIDGEVIHKDCLQEWASIYQKTTEKD